MDPSEKSERLIEAASAILNAAPRQRLNAVVLNKALFYLDLTSLRDTGATVTRNTYIALQQGPVIARYPSRLIAALENRGIGKQISEWDGSKPILLEKCPPHFRFVGADEMILVSAVTSYFADVSSHKASEFSHENHGWKLAWDTYRRSGTPTAVNMRIALQQIVEDDPWMDVPLFNDDEILAAADAAVGTDW